MVFSTIFVNFVSNVGAVVVVELTSDVHVVVSREVAAVVTFAVFFILVELKGAVMNNVEAVVTVEVATVTSV